MKIQINNTNEPKKFKPFTVSLEVETIEEARLLFHVFNHGNLKQLIDSDEFYNDDMEYSSLYSCGFDDYNGWEILKNEILRQGFKV